MLLSKASVLPSPNATITTSCSFAMERLIEGSSSSTKVDKSLEGELTSGFKSDGYDSADNNVLDVGYTVEKYDGSFTSASSSGGQSSSQDEGFKSPRAPMTLTSPETSNNFDARALPILPCPFSLMQVILSTS